MVTTEVLFKQLMLYNGLKIAGNSIQTIIDITGARCHCSDAVYMDSVIIRLCRYNHNHNNSVSKKVNKQVQQKKLAIRVGTIEKVLKQGRVVHDLKS